jgi:hypothetical protein
VSGAASGVRPEQRFTAERPCPICGGHDRLERGAGKRCHGFISEDSEWAHCAREEHAGDAPFNDKSEAFVHKLKGDCRCGVRHDLTAGESRVGDGRSKRRKGKRGRIVETYDYTDERGRLLYQAVRLEPKGFFQRRPDGREGWINNLEGVRRVVYSLPELLAAEEGEPVFIFEGEKDVDLAQSMGVVATTNAGGAGKWLPEYSDVLRGRRVGIVPDNDMPGRKHAEQVARSLHGKAASVKLLELPGLPEGGDFSDWTERPTNTTAELHRRFTGTEDWGPPEERDDGRKLIGRAIREGIDPPSVLVDDVILEAKAHAIYSGPGLGKTLWMLWAALEVVKRGAPVLIFDAENGLRTIAPRVEAFGPDLDRVDQLMHYYEFVSLPTTEEGRLAFEAKLDRIKPALVCFDSWLSFLAANGLDENSANDIATFAAHYIQPARRRGVATLLLDHVPHEGKHARGSSRKKDELDVVWALRSLQPFNRETTGQIVLHREKDREGWLPLDVTFSVGGDGCGGLVFSRSAGTFEAEGDDGLKDSERKALQALESFGESGAKASEWQRAAEKLGVKHRTFYNALYSLKPKNRVLQEKDRYILTSASKCNSSAMHQNAPDPDSSANGAAAYKAAPFAPTGAWEEPEDFENLRELIDQDEAEGSR